MNSLWKQEQQDVPNELRIEAALRLLDAEQVEDFVGTYENDRGKFVTDLVDWDKAKSKKQATPYQLDIMRLLDNNPRLAVVGPHGLGKTALSAWVILHFAIIYTLSAGDWKVVTTAGVWKQLEDFLWPEIHKWVRLLRWDKIPLPRFTPDQLLLLKLSTYNGAATAVSSKDFQFIEGAHARNILWLFDESKAIEDSIFNAAEGALSTPSDDGVVKAIALSTPGKEVGKFYKIVARKAGYEDWKVREVTLQECVDAGRVSLIWAEDRRKEWGEESSLYQNRVLGKFSGDTSDGVIPSEWLEIAFKRYDKLLQDPTFRKKRELNTFDWVAGGMDIADVGDDDSTFCLVDEDWIFSPIHVIPKVNKEEDKQLMIVSGKAVHLVTKYPDLTLALDALNIGAGVTQRAKEVVEELEYKEVPVGVIYSFKASARTEKTDLAGEQKLANDRSVAWWWFREVLNPAGSYKPAIPRSDRLKSELLAVGFEERSNATIQVESKLKIKKRLGHSTDYADPVVQAVFARLNAPKKLVIMLA